MSRPEKFEEEVQELAEKFRVRVIEQNNGDEFILFLEGDSYRRD